MVSIGDGTVLSSHGVLGARPSPVVVRHGFGKPPATVVLLSRWLAMRVQLQLDLTSSLGSHAGPRVSAGQAPCNRARSCRLGGPRL